MTERPHRRVLLGWRQRLWLVTAGFLAPWPGAAQAPDPPPADVVVLLHGLARSSRSMAKMEKHLQREGYAVVNVNYPSQRYPIEYLADEVLDGVLDDCCREATAVHFVTHSMGGIVVRYYLARHDLPNLGRVVMLSPPNQGSELVDLFRAYELYQAFNGPAGLQLGTDPESLPLQLGPVAFPLGVIMGDKSSNPLFSRLIPGPDDGTVAVERAKVEGMADFLLVPHGHTYIMRQREVMEQVVHFLRGGRFDHAGRL